jgi:hypothetical protein
MRNYFSGQALKVVEKDFKGSVKELGIEFLVYGALAEIFAKDYGFNRGLGGSMHAFFHRSGSCRITPSSAGRAIFPSARHCSSISTRSRES